jgi:hypothetical protein
MFSRSLLFIYLFGVIVYCFIYLSFFNYLFAGAAPAGSGTSCRERGKAGKAEAELAALVPFVAGVVAAFFLLPAPFFFISCALCHSLVSFFLCLLWAAPPLL